MQDFWKFGSVAPSLIEVTGTYQLGLVFLSFVIAIAGALALVRAVSRYAVAETPSLRMTWALGGSVAMACGIWAMHFVGMIALRLPIDATLDEALTTTSFVPGLAGSAAAVLVLAQPRPTRRSLHVGAVFLGFAISAMHYAGMEAVQFSGVVRYDPALFVLSLVGSYALALLALWINQAGGAVAARLSESHRGVLAATVLGSAVAALHYLGMEGTSFYTEAQAAEYVAQISPFALGAVIFVVALTFGIVWLSSLLDQRLAATSASLRESEIQNRTIIAAMQDAHLLADRSGRIVSANPAAAEMFGYTQAELTTKSVDSVLPSYGSVVTTYAFTRGANILDRKQRGLTARRRDGTEFPIELLVTSFTLKERVLFSATIRDLSEFAANIETNTRLMAAIDQSADGMAIFDRELRIKFANPAYWSSHGRDARERAPLTLRDLARDDAERQLLEEMLDQLNAGRPWSGVETRTRADGTTRVEEVNAAPVVIDGRINCYIQICRDITEQRAMEDKLRQAQKLESIGQLAAGIAHEINTPSQFVRDNIGFLKTAYADLMGVISAIRAGGHPEVQAQLLPALKAADFDFLEQEVPTAIDQSIDGMERITKIVRAMKEFSHPAHEKSLADLNHAIETTITVATNEWKYVADVEFDLDESLPRVPCMVHEFNQVILNIVVNAAHAIADVPGGKGKITVRTRRADPWAEISIADTGTGMTEEVKARIFDPFFTTKEVGRGTGQGLSLAYAVVVERHGGSIDVETAPGKGSRFIIRLPMQELLESSESPAAA